MEYGRGEGPDDWEARARVMGREEPSIKQSQLNNGFAALSVLTRLMVKDELKRALLDTSVEYHRAQDRDLQVKLAIEVAGIQVLLDSIAIIDKEFAEICQSSESPSAP